ncbi:MAG: carbohydrate-binding domain-containing protein [Ruminococcus sp.]|nr:carbohydrate-binding domain-containing protein [Ruminococcus sp.]
MLKKVSALILAAMLAASLTACGGSNPNTNPTANTGSSSAVQSSVAAEASNTSVEGTTFTERDMQQEADTADAKTLNVTSGQNTTITEAGVYIITGTATDTSVIVEAADDAKVQLVLQNLTITNSSTPAIYVKNADKVFVTTQKDTANTLTVTGAFTADGETNTDAVIFAKDDVVFNGEGSLTLSSTGNGVSGKDDVKITGGSLAIECAADAIEANDEISVAGGTITINSQKDGLHAENSDDNTQGSIYISGGTFDITAASDAIQGTTTVVIDGGTFTLAAGEGIEGTNVTINDGTINISASDDGINATNKSSEKVCITINGGNITINMGQGDTDGLDSNGDLTITGGTINITGQSACDYDGQAQKTGGTLIVNGVETDTIPNQMMGGGGRGGMGGPGGMAPGGMAPGGMGGF